MAANLTNVGEEWMQKCATQDHDPTSWEIGLYNDATDAITDPEDIADITTEPDTADDYARQTVTVPGNVTLSLDGSNNIQAEVADQTFSVSANTEIVDAWFIVVSFTSDVVNAESGDNPHLVITGALSSSKDLTDIDNLTVQDIGGTLD